MACFLVPMTTAVVTTVTRKKFPEKLHINWLNTMLWGGAIMSAVEHVINGEIVPYPPFLTAGLSSVLPEMLKVGVPMTLSIFVVWGVMLGVEALRNKKFVRT